MLQVVGPHARGAQAPWFVGSVTNLFLGFGRKGYIFDLYIK
jgi:hypothetical protein